MSEEKKCAYVIRTSIRPDTPEAKVQDFPIDTSVSPEIEMKRIAKLVAEFIGEDVLNVQLSFEFGCLDHGMHGRWNWLREEPFGEADLETAAEMEMTPAEAVAFNGVVGAFEDARTPSISGLLAALEMAMSDDPRDLMDLID